MKNPSESKFNKLFPYFLGPVLFFIITIVYFNPVLEGKRINSSDVSNATGTSKEIQDFREKTGKEALWTNSLFGGMPAVQISVIYSKNLMRYVDKVIKLGYFSPIGMVFLYMLGFFFLLLTLRVNVWLSILGAIGFGFSSFFFNILEAGHNTQAIAIGYMAPVLAGIIMTYRRNVILGGILTAFFLSLELVANHLQITYYLFLMILLYGIFELYAHIKEKQIRKFTISTAVLVLAGVMAILTNSANLWGTYEYSKETIRGKSELTHNQENRTSGLDKDYATAWSYGIPETMTLLIPDFQGGSSSGALSKDSETYKVLKDNRVPNSDQIIKQMPLYWGTQPFTAGTVYVGAIMVFLFIFSLFVLKGPFKYWGITVTILSIMLAWGKNFMPLTDFFLDYFPFYNKFRTVSMILVLAEITIPLFAVLALNKLMSLDLNRKIAFKYLKISLYICGGILLFFYLFATSLFTFTGPQDASYGLPDWLMPAIRDDRIHMFKMDAIRSLIFILLGFGVIWAFLYEKIKKSYAAWILILLVLIDMWAIDKRVLNNDDFTSKSAVMNPFKETKADRIILGDKDPDFRVYDLAEPFDKSARTSYFHKNLGGYHGAKLRRYQELIDFDLNPERSQLVSTLQNKPTQATIDATLQQLPVFNMLNTRYIIYNDDADPIYNPYALGNAWFVKNFKLVNNADEEIGALSNFNPDSVMIVDKRFENQIKDYRAPEKLSGQIKLSSYQPNHLVYDYTADSEQLTVFSEIYYKQGWDAFIDGKKSSYFRVNYVLRAMLLPPGNHKIDFIFEPKSFYVGENISLFASSIILLLVLGAIFSYIFPGIQNKWHKTK